MNCWASPPDNGIEIVFSGSAFAVYEAVFGASGRLKSGPTAQPESMLKRTISKAISR
jgi:hypothetical protein